MRACVRGVQILKTLLVLVLALMQVALPVFAQDVPAPRLPEVKVYSRGQPIYRAVEAEAKKQLSEVLLKLRNADGSISEEEYAAYLKYERRTGEELKALAEQIKNAELSFERGNFSAPGRAEKYAQQLASQSAEIAKQLEENSTALKKMSGQRGANVYRTSTEKETANLYDAREKLIQRARETAIDVAMYQGVKYRGYYGNKSDAQKLVEWIPVFLYYAVAFKIGMDVMRSGEAWLLQPAPYMEGDKVVEGATFLLRLTGGAMGTLGAIFLTTNEKVENIYQKFSHFLSTQTFEWCKASSRKRMYWAALNSQASTVGMSVQALQAILAPYACVTRSGKVKIRIDVGEAPVKAASGPRVAEEPGRVRVGDIEEPVDTHWATEAAAETPKKQMKIGR